jgi:CRISPR/Cas system-associated protein endoribonuclease Cas2
MKSEKLSLYIRVCKTTEDHKSVIDDIDHLVDRIYFSTGMEGNSKCFIVCEERFLLLMIIFLHI